LGKFQAYNIQLNTLSIGEHTFNLKLDNQFFRNIDSEVLQKGEVDVVVTVKRNATDFELRFDIQGVIQVPCNRCLDDMALDVAVKEHFFVKFGKEYAEEDDNVVIVPEEEGAINVAWFLYEFVALAIPIKHVHPAGKCNKMMSAKLRKHIAKVASDDDNEEDDDSFDIEDDITSDGDTVEIDPRWNELKKLIE